MKTTTSKNTFIRLPAVLAAALGLLLATGLPSTVHADPDTESSVLRTKFEDQSKPGTLKIDVFNGKIKIEGAKSNEIVITSNLPKLGEPKVDADGFRRLDQESSFNFMNQKGNVIELRTSRGDALGSKAAEFDIKVPRNTNIVIKSQNAADDGIEISDLEGDVEVNVLNGKIDLEDVTGAIVANTNMGKIEAEFKKSPTKSVSLATMNGAIELALPADAKANVRMRTLNGALRTNFPESALKTTTTRDSIEARKIDMQIKMDRAKGTNVVVVGDSAVPPTPPTPPTAPASPAEATDAELVETIVATQKAQMLEYADKGLKEAMKGVDEAMKAIENSKELNAETKELIKRKIVAATEAMPKTFRAPPGRPNVGGKTLTGELNGGGVEIQLSTLNGSITLKKDK